MAGSKTTYDPDGAVRQETTGDGGGHGGGGGTDDALAALIRKRLELLDRATRRPAVPGKVPGVGAGMSAGVSFGAAPAVPMSYGGSGGPAPHRVADPTLASLRYLALAGPKKVMTPGSPNTGGAIYYSPEEELARYSAVLRALGSMGG